MNNDWKKWMVFGSCVLIWTSWVACNSEILRPNIDHTTFLKLYGGANDQTGLDLIQPAGGGFMLLGSSNSTDDPATGGQNQNMYWVQTDSLGNALKSQVYDRSSVDEGKAIFELAEGFLLLGNVLNENGMSNIWLIRSDENGIPLWQKEMGKAAFDDVGEHVLLDQNDHIWIVGTTTDVNIHKQEGFSSTTDVSDVYLAKLDLEGNQLWERRLGFEGEDVGKSLLSLGEGRMAVLGHTDFPNPDPQPFDLLFFTVDGSGIPLASQRFGHMGRHEQAEEMILLQGGEILLLGNAGTDSSMQPYLLAIDDSNQPGNEIEYQMDIQGQASGIAELPGGGFVLSGSTQSGGDQDFLLLKLGPDRVLQWSRTFGSTGDSFAGNILALSDSAFVFVGTHAFGSNHMMSLIQTNQEGKLNP